MINMILYQNILLPSMLSKKDKQYAKFTTANKQEAYTRSAI